MVAAQGGMGQISLPMAQHPDSLDPRRKRLLWRATHRGVKEMDLILGGFAQKRIAALTESQLRELEAIIDLPDQDLLTWATKQGEVPSEHGSALLFEMLQHRP
jgi:antitoxin CptB